MNKDPLEWNGILKIHKYFKLDKDTKKKQSLFSFVHHNHFHIHDKEGFPVRTNLRIVGNPGGGSVRGFTILSRHQSM